MTNAECLEYAPYTRVLGETPHSIRVCPMPDLTQIVYVVDDDLSVRESLELLIGHAGWQPVLLASAVEFLGRSLPHVPSCLVLDISLPGISGLELQQHLAGRADIPIIFITGYGDIPMTVRAMKAGAIEFLTKPFNDGDLLTAIHNALEHSRAALNHDEAMRAIRRDYASLTPREREIMTLVISGLLNKQIGQTLGISEITVKAHRGQVMRKMHAASLPDLVTMATRLGLLPVADPAFTQSPAEATSA